MATKNIVPRADGEGELGTSSKKWSKVQAVTGSFDHIQTTTMTSEIYSEGSTKFGDTSDDTHIFTGSAAVYSDNGVTLQATSSTPSGTLYQHNFLNITTADGNTAATFRTTVDNPFGAPSNLLIKSLDVVAESGTDVGIMAGTPDPIYGTGGNLYLAAPNTAYLEGQSSAISAGSYVSADTSYFLVNGTNPGADDLLFYARPSSYGSGHNRYTSFGYDTVYGCSRFTAGSAGAGGDNQFIWYVSNDTDSEFEVMFLDFSGNLGIGTTTPAKTLDVVGNISASQEISASSFWGDGSNLSGITAATASNADKIDVVENPAGSADFRVAFVDNIGSGYEQVYVDTGLVYNPNTEIFKVTDVEVTNAVTASGINSGPLHIHGSSVHSGTIDMYAGGGLYLYGENGIESGSLKHSGGGLLLGNTFGVPVGLLSPNSQAFMSNGAASLNVDGNDVNLTPNAAGRVSVDGNAEITGSLIIRESDGVTVQKGNGNTIGSIYHSGSSTFDVSAIDILKLSSDADINMAPGAGDKVNITGDLEVSSSSKFGNESTDTHQFTGSIHLSGGFFAGTESPEEHHQIIGTLLVDAAGTNNSELIVDGPNPNYIVLKRNGNIAGQINTGGGAFTFYGGNSSTGNNAIAGQFLYDSSLSTGITHFKDTATENFAGNDCKVNISASSRAFRIDTDTADEIFMVQDATTSFVSGSGDLLTMDDTTAPPTPSNAAHLYAKSGEMYVMDTGGNETQISPHDEDGEWQYFSRNTRTGKVVRIRMEKMIRKLEEITGETFIEEE